MVSQLLVLSVGHQVQSVGHQVLSAGHQVQSVGHQVVSVSRPVLSVGHQVLWTAGRVVLSVGLGTVWNVNTPHPSWMTALCYIYVQRSLKTKFQRYAYSCTTEE